jgi:hypothetical protein
MSRNSIKAVDLYCSVANWNDSIANAYPDEIERWTVQRDRKLASFRKGHGQSHPRRLPVRPLGIMPDAPAPRRMGRHASHGSGTAILRTAAPGAASLPIHGP